jgi:hypothetical protein
MEHHGVSMRTILVVIACVAALGGSGILASDHVAAQETGGNFNSSGKSGADSGKGARCPPAC